MPSPASLVGTDGSLWSPGIQAEQEDPAPASDPLTLPSPENEPFTIDVEAIELPEK